MNRDYPRPQLVRDNYTLLNGEWDYKFSIHKAAGDYDGKIIVPYSPESRLSGVERTLLPGNYLHYRKFINIEKLNEHKRLLLHFEAVDEYAEVYINDFLVGHHHGGYLPFYFDITDYIHAGENEIRVVVQDDTEYSYHARGKQKLHHGGMYYTAQSGIWQSVWMEEVEEVYIENVYFTPHLETSEIEINVITSDHKLHDASIDIAAPYDHKYSYAINNFHFTTNRPVLIPLKEVRVWSLEDPYLYDVTIHLDKDEVTSYFGMRKLSTKNINGHKVMALNDKPVFHLGILDQGYYKDSLMSAPSDEAIVKDLELVKTMGFNTIRKHAKIEPSRWYYHCDRLGILVMQDMVNGGDDYDDQYVTILPNLMPILQKKVSDKNNKRLSRNTQESQDEYYTQLKEMLLHLHNFVCIDTWVAFNEGWGQFDSLEVTDFIKDIDEQRFVDSASGWFDQGGGDFNSIHNYFLPLRLHHGSRIQFLSEFGGKSLEVEGHSDSKKQYGYGKKLTSKKELMKAYLDLIRRDVFKNIPKGLSGIIYTQFSDIEDEVNGLITYDREVIKFDEAIMKAISKDILLRFEREVKRNG